MFRYMLFKMHPIEGLVAKVLGYTEQQQYGSMTKVPFRFVMTLFTACVACNKLCLPNNQSIFECIEY